MNYVTLNNGVKMPMIGFGVFEIPKEETARCVYEALEVGYRLIDTAQAYYNEEETGDGIRQAIQKLGINREGITIGVFQFNNPNGLERLADSLYQQTAASGQAINEARNNNVEKSSIIQGYLESSNVQVVDEMVNMIVAQRAYELNSKAITASDEMLQQANNLRR